MQFKPRLALASALTLALIGPLASGCASVRPIVAAPSACSTLIAPSLRADVEPVDLPPASATAGDVWTALDGQTGRLDTANTYKRAAIETVEACEKRDASTVAKLQAPWWKRPFLR